jgi:large subunit ribosomal protein L25
MDKIELTVANRELLGKKVRFLRHQGITPVHLFGHGIESMTLQCDTVELKRVMAKAGKTRLINLNIDGEKKPRNAVIREVQIEPLTGQSIHVDFYQVKMKERMKVDVPVVLTGESPALKSKDNMLLHELNILEIECLPGNIPSSIEIDITSLTEGDQSIRVGDINLDKEITIINDPEQVVVRIGVRHAEVVEEVEALEEEVTEAPIEAEASEKGSEEE